MSLSYKDGALKKGHEPPSPYLNDYKIVDTPTLLEVMSFTFSSVGCVFGPYYEFKDHRDFMNREGNYANIPWTFLASLIKQAEALSKNYYSFL